MRIMLWAGVGVAVTVFLTYYLIRTLRTRRRRYTSDRHQWWAG
ncbi:MAG TPA: hypothetical protein VGO91_16810 [Pyrinomonadaceae bacterium]|nr:hypothetical protein [Pyrinomonadaceae bacterium]